MSAANLAGWTPIRIRTAGPVPAVDWAIVDRPFSEPFFEQTADRAMQHPFNLAFARRTPIAAIEALHDRDPGLSPVGFVFHMSRCGSTLIAQMLSALNATIVLSEAQPLDALLRMRRERGEADATLIRRLRAAAGVLGYPRRGEQRLIVKLHAWHVLELPLIAKAFPGVPWAFVFRETAAVLRSHARIEGAELVHGGIDPSYLALTADSMRLVPSAEYGLRVLAAFCEAALVNERNGRPLFLDYTELPEAVFTRLLPHYGITPTAQEVDRMRAIATADTKRTGTFSPAQEAHGSGAPEPAASGRLDHLYAQLRAVAAAAR